MKPQRRLRFLVDVCTASRALTSMLVGEGHDVVIASRTSPESDEFLMGVALREGRILITEDKDYGELVFAQGMAHPCIVRLHRMSAPEQVTAMRKLIGDEAESMVDGAMIVVTRDRVRVSSGSQGGD